MYATYLAKRTEHDIKCLIVLNSENKNSYMFHTPSIEKTKFQAERMGIPLITVNTKGEKEEELEDLNRAIKEAIKKYGIEGVVTGAVESVYQATRVQKICNDLALSCFNPLWQKDQIELLEDLIKNKFHVIISGVFAYPLDESWIGKKIDFNFIREVKKLQKEYKINVAGEGGEFESFVVNCPLFDKKIKIKEIKTTGEKNSFWGEMII